MYLIKGEKYIFRIESKKYNFAIKAQCKSTNRYSYINNLNIVLSEFGINVDNPRVANSTWEIAKYEADKLVNIAKNLFADRPFLYYLEKQLDLDRELSERENR